MWAEQGDEISLEYAGTNALKGDLVRYEIFYNESSVFMFRSDTDQFWICDADMEKRHYLD